MALLAAFMQLRDAEETLEDFLDKRVFAKATAVTLEPQEQDVAGYRRFLKRFIKSLDLEHTIDIENG